MERRTPILSFSQGFGSAATACGLILAKV